MSCSTLRIRLCVYLNFQTLPLVLSYFSPISFVVLVGKKNVKKKKKTHDVCDCDCVWYLPSIPLPPPPPLAILQCLWFLLKYQTSIWWPLPASSSSTGSLWSLGDTPGRRWSFFAPAPSCRRSSVKRSFQATLSSLRPSNKPPATSMLRTGG